VGIEDLEDILWDLDQAIAASQRGGPGMPGPYTAPL
jgi:hypothetical protein